MSQTTSQELATSFEPADIEARWYPIWENRGYFKAGSDPAKPGFAIQLPPPNITGILHMGHAFNQTVMDSLTRYYRMSGYNTLWLPGTDHAGIATQIVVERQLQGEGKDRRDIGRDEFIKRIWDWQKISGGTILNQMRRLGDSLDWSRLYFTMDEKLSKTVKKTFIQLYREGLIYRGSARSRRPSRPPISASIRRSTIAMRDTPRSPGLRGSVNIFRMTTSTSARLSRS